MEKICTNCKYIGKEVRTRIYIIAPIVLIVFSIAILRKYSIIDGLGAFIWLAFGIYSLKIFIDKPSECPNCKQKRTMIPLDTPRAQTLIKEHNLTIPEESLQQAAPKTSQ